MPTSQIEVMDRARELATRLAAAATPVKANTLRSILADFMSAPDPDPAQLRRMLELLAGGSGGHLLRSGKYPDEVVAAIPVLTEVLEKGGLDPRELKSLFGWTARLLLVRGRKGGPPPSSKRPGRSEPPRRRSTAPSEPDRTFSRPAEKLGGVKGSSFAALAEMKEKLEKKDDGGG